MDKVRRVVTGHDDQGKAIVVADEITLELDDGVMTVLRAGDANIQNGTRHRWHTHGSTDAVVVVVVGAVRDS